jgi:hypothetical protein
MSLFLKKQIYKNRISKPYKGGIKSGIHSLLKPEKKTRELDMG